jgi:hypothetical protein
LGAYPLGSGAQVHNVGVALLGRYRGGRGGRGGARLVGASGLQPVTVWSQSTWPHTLSPVLAEERQIKGGRLA